MRTNGVWTKLQIKIESLNSLEKNQVMHVFHINREYIYLVAYLGSSANTFSHWGPDYFDNIAHISNSEEFYHQKVVTILSSKCALTTPKSMSSFLWFLWKSAREFTPTGTWYNLRRHIFDKTNLFLC